MKETFFSFLDPERDLPWLHRRQAIRVEMKPRKKLVECLGGSSKGGPVKTPGQTSVHTTWVKEKMIVGPAVHFFNQTQNCCDGGKLVTSMAKVSKWAGEIKQREGVCLARGQPWRDPSMIPGIYYVP